MIAKPHTVTLGRRKQPALMHCGTILPTWTPEQLLTPSARLRGNSNKKTKKQRQRWYADRAKLYRYSTNGRPRNGGQQFQCPVHAGRLTTPGSAASASYSSPLVSAGGSVCCGGKVTARLDSADMDFYQQHPYGTPVWQASYSRRNRAESVIGKLKDKNRLGGEACKALGLAANTLAAVAVVVAYNRKLARSQKRKRRNNSAAADAASRPGGAARTRGPDTAADSSDADTPPRAPP